MLSSHLRLSLPSVLFTTGFQVKIMYAFLIYIMQVTHHDNLIFLNLMFVTILGEYYKL